MPKEIYRFERNGVLVRDMPKNVRKWIRSIFIRFSMLAASSSKETQHIGLERIYEDTERCFDNDELMLIKYGEDTFTLLPTKYDLTDSETIEKAIKDAKRRTDEETEYQNFLFH